MAQKYLDLTGLAEFWKKVKEHLVANYAPKSHTHTIAQVTGLQDALDGKASIGYVDTKIDEKIKASDAMIYKGTIAPTGATFSTLPEDAKIGWTIKVAQAGKYVNQQCEVGDMIICLKEKDIKAGTPTEWTVVQNNIDLATITNQINTAKAAAIEAAATDATSKANAAKTAAIEAAATDATKKADAAKTAAIEAAATDATSKANAAQAAAATDATKKADAAKAAAIETAATDATKKADAAKTAAIEAAATDATSKANAAQAAAIETAATDATSKVNTHADKKAGTGLGHIKAVVSPTAMPSGLKLSATTNRYYPVATDSTGNAFVNVPWTDTNTDTNTTYTFASGTNGSFTVKPSTSDTTTTVSIGKPATAGTADKVANALNVEFYDSTGSVVSADTVTYNGSAVRTVKISAITTAEIDKLFA